MAAHLFQGISRVIIAVGGLVVPVLCEAQQNSPRARMESLGADLGKGKVSEQQVEDEYMKIVKEAKSPKEQGKIYAHLAYTLSVRPDKPNPDKVIRYAEMALKNPLDPEDEISAHKRIAESLGRKHKEARGKNWANARSEVVRPRLRALKVVLDNLTETKRIPLPAVNPYTCDGGKDCAELDERHSREVAERARLEFQNRLIDERDSLIRTCIEEYAFAKDGELPELAALQAATSDVLRGHTDVAQSIVAKATARQATAREKLKIKQNQKSEHPPADMKVPSKRAKPVDKEVPRK